MAFDFKLPDLGEGIHEAEILAVKVSEGQVITEDQILFEVETDKAVVEIPSPKAGKVTKILVKAGEIVTTGSVMISIEESGQKQTTEKEVLSRNNGQTKASALGNIMATQSSTESAGTVIATPATRQLAREMKVDLHKVKGSGPGGKISKEDILAFAEDQKGSKIPTANTKSDAIAKTITLPDFSKHGQIERVPIRSLRRKTAELMALSWSKIPHVMHSDKANISELEKYRLKHQESTKSKGAKLTLTAFIMKAASIALQEYPDFNTSLDEQTQEIIFKRYYNIGMAVATDRGLIVPVIKSVDKKSIVELAVEISEIAEKARAAKSELTDLQGATFTVTNIGAIGGTSATPIVHYPEAAILAVMKTREEAIVNSGKIEPGLVVPLCLAFDHRLADGAEAARFVRTIVKMLEEPKSFDKYLGS